MSNAVVPVGIQLPDHLRAKAAAALAAQTEMASGIRDNSFASISIDSSKFYLQVDGEKTLIADDQGLPKARIEIVAIGANPSSQPSKTFYLKKIKQGEKGGPPDCSSEDGITPDDGVPAKQHDSCALCEKNKFGSAISEYSGKQTKACGDAKTIVVLPVEDLEFQPTQFKIPVMGMQGWKKYVDDLTKQGIPVKWVVTGIRFDPSVSFPLPVFEYMRMLSEEEIAAVEIRAEEPETKRVASPRRYGQSLAKAGAAFIQAAQPAMPVVAPFSTAPAPAAAPAPVPPQPAPASVVSAPAVVTPSPVAPAPAPATAPAPAAAGFGKKKAPPKPAPAPVAPAPVAHDPWQGTLDHVKLAVNGVGGLGTQAGEHMYQALMARPSGVPVAGPAPVAAASAPAVAAPVAAPAASQAPAAAGQVGQLDDLLASVMGS